MNANLGVLFAGQPATLLVYRDHAIAFFVRQGDRGEIPGVRLEVQSELSDIRFQMEIEFCREIVHADVADVGY